MGDIIIYAAITLLGTLSSTTCYSIAFRKALNPMLWVILGFLLGPLAILLALTIPTQTTGNRQQSSTPKSKEQRSNPSIKS